MSYQVIARKYRPLRFSDITAQEHITHTIQNALRLDRVGHGYIFSGLRGVGKTTAARIFAKAVNCERMIADETYRHDVTEPCGECESCRDFDSGASLNISEFDAASNNSVDDIRQLRENVRYGPQKGRYRVYIIDEVHMLSTAAFNAFLKTLEEPPAHAIFIFATTELHKIPATISSRCQRFNFKRIPLDAIQRQLQDICRQEGIEAGEDVLQLVARKAQGSMRDAQSILDQVIAFSIDSEGRTAVSYENVSGLLNYIDDEHFFAVSDAVAANDPAAMLNVARFVIENGYDEQDFLEKLIEHFRNFLVLYNLRSPKLIERTEAVKERYQQSAADFSPGLLMNSVELLLQASKELKYQFEHQFRFELTLLRLIELAHGREIKKKAPEPAVVSQPESTSAPSHGRSRPRSALQQGNSADMAASAPPRQPVSQPRPSVPLPKSALNFSSWQDKLSKFTRNSSLQSHHTASSRGGGAQAEFEGVAEVQKFRTEWNQFLEELLRKQQNVLVTHLRSCELTSCHDGVLVMTCSRKFSYEELTRAADQLLQEIDQFYGIPVQLRICYDAEKGASNREQTVFTLFRELAESNDVVKYLVREFGGELVY